MDPVKGKSPVVTPQKVSGSPQSVKSESVSLSDQVRELLQKSTVPVTYKGDTAMVLTAEKAQELKVKLGNLLDDGECHSVPSSVLATLRTELASAKFELTLFKDQAEKADYAKNQLAKDLESAKIALDKEREASKKLTSTWDSERGSLVQEVAARKTERDALKKALDKAKEQVNNSDDVDMLTIARDQMTAEIANLQNKLANGNKEVKDTKAQVARFEDQVLRLTQELNIARLRASVPPMPQSFAEKARATSSETVDIAGKFVKNLSKTSIAFLDNVEKEEAENVKGHAYWLRNAVSKSPKNVLLKPYRDWLDELPETLAIINLDQRHLFSDPIMAIYDSLRGKTVLLTDDDFVNLFEPIDTKAIKVSKPFVHLAGATLFDFQASGKSAKEIVQTVKKASKGMNKNDDAEEGPSSRFESGGTVTFRKGSKGKEPSNDEILSPLDDDYIESVVNAKRPARPTVTQRLVRGVRTVTHKFGAVKSFFRFNDQTLGPKADIDDASSQSWFGKITRKVCSGVSAIVTKPFTMVAQLFKTKGV